MYIGTHYEQKANLCVFSQKNRLYSTGNDAGEKRKRALQKYLAKSVWRLNAAFSDSSAETESDCLKPDESQNCL